MEIFSKIKDKKCRNILRFQIFYDVSMFFSPQRILSKYSKFIFQKDMSFSWNLAYGLNNNFNTSIHPL